MEDKQLSAREREAIDAVYALESASVEEVQARLSGTPSYAATRMILQRLHKKGRLTAAREGKRYFYAPVVAADTAGLSALRSLLGTFFQGSTTKAVSALLDGDRSISAKELDELEALIQAAKEQRQ